MDNKGGYSASGVDLSKRTKSIPNIRLDGLRSGGKGLSTNRDRLEDNTEVSTKNLRGLSKTPKHNCSKKEKENKENPKLSQRNHPNNTKKNCDINNHDHKSCRKFKDKCNQELDEYYLFFLSNKLG